MAIASVGGLGTAGASTSGNTLAFSMGTACEAGNVCVIVVAADNISATDGNNNEHTSIVTSVAADWCKLGEYTNSNGSAAAGATVSVWCARPRSDLAIGTTVTINFSANLLDRVASLWEFSAAGDISLVAFDGGNGTDGGNDFGSVSIANLTSRSRLYLRGLAKEANSTTNITNSTNFTVITGGRSRNNAAAMLVRGEFRINTSTGETSNPTLAVVGDTAGVFVAVEETKDTEISGRPFGRSGQRQTQQLLAQ